MLQSRFPGVASFAAGIVVSAMASAADIRPDPSAAAGMGAVLEGKIEPGDFAKFQNFILEHDKVAEIYLASPGGNLNEALKIGILTRMLRLSTVVPSRTLTNQARELAVAQHDLRQSKADYLCASACFFIFVSGINRKSDGFGPAILGIHRPSLSDQERKTLEYEQIAAAADQMRAAVVKYLTVMDAPERYAAEMFAVPPGKIRWIRNDEFDEDFKGIIPRLRDKFNAKCGTHTGGTADAMPLKQSHCEKDFEAEMALYARQEFVKRWSNQSARPNLQGMPAH
jgi:hypothetical protein